MDDCISPRKPIQTLENAIRNKDTDNNSIRYVSILRRTLNKYSPKSAYWGILRNFLNGSSIVHLTGCCICCYSLAFKPDGSELLLAGGDKIYIYDPVDGTMMQTLKGHKELVYCLTWSFDGELFASGSADKSVIIWTDKHEGQLKYSHSEAIQCLEFSPTASILLSCGQFDFAIWSMSEKTVHKQRMNARCTSCAWNKDGTIFAIGTHEGSVYIRKLSNINDDPLAKIDRPSHDPIVSVKYSLPPRAVDDGGLRVKDDIGEMLTILDGAGTISFYDNNASKLYSKDIQLNFQPTCMTYSADDKYLVIGGSNKQLLLYTRMGTYLGAICRIDSWIWSVAQRPNSNSLFVGCVDGTIGGYQMTFSTVHGLYQDRYAFRDSMTDVVITHLLYHTMARIKCSDCVRKVAIYSDKLAIQLSDRCLIYREVSGARENEPMEYKMVDKFTIETECHLLVVTAKHVIVCNDCQLVCYDQKGLKQREWILESSIRYIKTIGGPEGKEMVLMGLRDGQVCKVFVDNPFPVYLIRRGVGIKCLDISVDRERLALVDEDSVCVVTNLRNMEALLQETHCKSVVFNADNENVMCYTTDTELTIKVDNYPGFTQRMNGFVVGFAGNKVFCLHNYSLRSIEVPFSNQLYQYIENKQYDKAYNLAVLGVTETDWSILARDAMENMELDIAAKAFFRIKDYKSLQLIHEIKEMQDNGESEVLVKAHLMAHQNRFREVAALYRQNGYENKAMELFTDLKMFEDAQEVMHQASGETQKMLMRKRADWARDSNQPKVAAEMLISSGDLDKATQLIIENDWIDLALLVMRKLDRGDLETLRTLAAYFVRKGEYTVASRIYSSLNDTKSMVQMHVSAGHWNDAFAIADRYPKFVEDVYLPYARHLAENDHFDEAQKAFHKAGRDQEAFHVLEQLTQNAVNEHRFEDAGYYYWLLSMQHLERSAENDRLIPSYREAAKKAEIYYAYHAVYQYCHQPFTSHSPESILNMARFIVAQPKAPNTSNAIAYFAIAKIGRELGAFKLSRDALDHLGKLRVPFKLQKTVDIMTLTIRAKPFSDAEELLPVCYRCGQNNSLSVGLCCSQCQTQFVLSFATFEVLPLLEFFLTEDIEREEARRLIEAEPPLTEANFNPFHSTGRRKIDDIILDRDGLAKLERGQVLIHNLPNPLKCRYFYNLMPSIAVSMCSSCMKVFHTDDYEMSLLQKGACPFCRTVPDRSNKAVYMDDDD